MWKHASALALAIAALSCLSASAQAPAAKYPGLTPTTLMDKPEVRIVRVEIQPGAEISQHAHTDAVFHLLAPLTGSVQLSVESNSPEEVAPGQVYFLTGGTRHGYKNTGSAPGRLLEIFVKTTSAARVDPAALGAIVAGLADVPSLPSR